VKAFGDRGSNPNQFNTPHGITSDAKGNIYVADRGNRRVQVYDPDLNHIRIRDRGAPGLSVFTGRDPVPVQRRRKRQVTRWIWRQSDRLGPDEPRSRPGRLLIHELHCESENVIIKVIKSWTVENTISSGVSPTPPVSSSQTS
jgi:hypothetical protein